jgi:hypothetical protein
MIVIGILIDLIVIFNIFKKKEPIPQKRKKLWHTNY